MEASISRFGPDVKPLISPFNIELKTMEEIVNAWNVYRRPREPKEFYAFAEQATMQKHLDVLMVDLSVGEEDGRYYRVWQSRFSLF
jgi:hypothetical protein